MRPWRVAPAAALVTALLVLAPAWAGGIAAIEGEAVALGAIAQTGVPPDGSALTLRNAQARLSALVIAAIAERPDQRRAILGAAQAAAPGLAAAVVADAATAFPGFAAEFADLDAPAEPLKTAAATKPARANRAPGSENAADPLEDINRVTFALNDAVDTLVLRPIAAVYGYVVPLPIKTAVANFYHNLKTPVVMANDLLQGRVVSDGAATTLARFGINSTIGIAGFIDLATSFGIPGHDNDFGQTLFRYGAGPGVYLVLPLFGPSNARDATGTVIDSFFDPLGYVLPQAARLGLLGGKAVSKREAVDELLDQLRQGSLDYYTAMRGAFQQRRVQELGVETPASAAGATDPFAEFE
ncbi:MAG: VacJ family lipoprotein [Alphaproteobacteria bacterium]|nr:VacJ family lipoprotein [Alphaproteobacteria bacterium]